MGLLEIMNKLRPTSHQAEEIKLLVEQGFREFGVYSELIVYIYITSADVKDKVTVLAFEYNGKFAAARFADVYNFTELSFHMVTGDELGVVLDQLISEAEENKESPRTRTDLIGTPELRFEIACKIIQHLMEE